MLRRFPLLLLLAVLLLPVSAPGREEGQFATREEDDCYLTASGQALTGLQQISGKTYFFDSQGKQFHGWKKIDGRYLYFARGRKEKGYLVTSKTVHGFSIGKTGKASLKTRGEKKRMKAMAYVSAELHKRTRSSWSRKKKLKALYTYASALPYLYDDTDKTAAECVLKFKKQVDGDCADTNTFLAFAGALLGYPSYVVNDYGHWWALIDGRICDTNYQMFLKKKVEALLSFPYDGRLQAIKVTSQEAGSVMMTVHPERYCYDTRNLTVLGGSADVPGL